MHECFERVFCELKWRKQVRTTPFLFLSGKHMTTCQVWNSILSLLLEFSLQIQKATNVFSSGFCFRLLILYCTVLIAFHWQVEEEASDKDNKNCSNNGKQHTFSCPKYKEITLFVTHTQSTTQQSAEGQEARFYLGHIMKKYAVRCGAEWCFEWQQPSSTMINAKFLLSGKKEKKRAGLHVCCLLLFLSIKGKIFLKFSDITIHPTLNKLHSDMLALFNYPCASTMLL